MEEKNKISKLGVVGLIGLIASILTIIGFTTGKDGPELFSTPQPVQTPSIHTPAPTPEVTPTPSHEDTTQAGHQSSNAYQELLDKCLLFDSSLELPFEAEMLDQTVIRYVEGSFPKSKSGGMYLCKSPGAEQIALLKPHTPVTVHAVRGSLSESTGYAFVETGTGQFGWVAFQSTRGTGIGLAETNDF